MISKIATCSLCFVRFHLLFTRWQENISRMEFQPPEILVHIFRQLPRIKEITNCFKTSKQWRQIIEHLFINKSKFARPFSPQQRESYFISPFIFYYTPLARYQPRPEGNLNERNFVKVLFSKMNLRTIMLSKYLVTY